jgi:hypothetical protein
MADYDNNYMNERNAFLAAWHKLEKSFKRVGGVLMLFAGGLILAFDNPGDATQTQLTILAAAGLIAGGLTLIFRSRGAVDAYTNLYFLQLKQQSSQGLIAGLGAAFLLYQGVQSGRALFWIGALVAAGFWLWFRWRAAKITEYTERFKRDEGLVVTVTEEEVQS